MSRFLVPALLCAVAGAGVLSSLPFGHVAHAGDVRGQLVLGSLRDQGAAQAAKPPRAACNWELENGVKEVKKDRVHAERELAVVLVGPGASKLPATLDVEVSGGELLPATVVLRSGTTLRIRNADEIGHALGADGLDGFSAEASSPGGVRAVNLTKVGHWDIVDKLVAHARAHLHVLPDVVALAKLEDNGSFTFSGVTPGKYTLKVFRGDSEILAKPVEVLNDKSLSLDPLTFTDAPTQGGS